MYAPQHYNEMYSMKNGFSFRELVLCVWVCQ